MIVAADPLTLKPWLVRALEPISDAEPLVLADYVLALLKRDVRDLDDLRQSCVNELDDFLQQHSAPFVDSLLRVLQQPDRPSALEVVPDLATTASSASLKRARSPQPAPSSAKLPRTEAGEGGQTARGGAALPRVAGPASSSSRVSSGRAAGRPVDRPPCRDYHFRGFCARGDACPYQHNALPVAAGHPPAPFPSTFPPPFAAAARLYPPAAHTGAPSFSFPRDGPSRRAASSASIRSAGDPSRQPAPAARPPRGTSRVISVDNIPPTSLTDAAVRHFFQPFGTILHLGLDVDGRSATITFSAPHEADRALASPQAVFGNRFVRVYRARDPGPVPPASAPSGGQERVATGARLATTTPALDGNSIVVSRSTRHPEPAARAHLLERNAEQQRALLSEVQGAGAERKRDIMVALRALAAEADALRSRPRPDVAEPAPGDARAASLGIDTTTTPTAGPRPYGGPAATRPRPPPPLRAQQYRLDNRSRVLRIGPLGEEAVLRRLRAHLEHFGEVVALKYDHEGKEATVEFAVRKSAEQALASGHLPPEFGAAELSWASSGKPPPSTAATSAAPVDVGLDVDEPHEVSPSSGSFIDAARGREDDMKVDVKGEDEERSWNR
ncbi:hypothetical protein JCM3775_007525 [Rhodotorula graminis]|uniref:C3H1-type domain-containing protein n=1 Tax=Rhodotorula graminis (strain WP1) TaxID=578459 RepID=A0A0P9EEP7_RHOGW|nr:uncharacterized protein RHOBADRAFT_56252 [Rhodotorula graminis WP1]KPV71864.1 hypothetical protein RHOBADRAFT_56252 [Rhodotorula graminis WP1]